MFNEKTMPIQLRDYREHLMARDEFHAALHGDLLEEDLGQFYRRSRERVTPASVDGIFNFAYLRVRQANSLWRCGRWNEATVAVTLTINVFDGKAPEEGK